jgi:ethanolamine utilization protein EutQ (cupin superfamily)
MKKLICVKDVEKLIENNETKILLTPNTILTPAAKDMLDINNIGIIFQEQKQEIFNNLELDKLIEVFKLFARDEQTRKLIEKILIGNEYEQIINERTGIVITRQKGMKFKKINGEFLNIEYQEFFQNGEIGISRVRIKNSQFYKKISQNEIVYVISGELKLILEEMVYEIKTGDVFYVPKKVENLKILVENNTELFYQAQSNTWKQDIIEGGISK